MPDNSTSVIIQGKKRFRMTKLTGTEPYYTAMVGSLPDVKPVEEDKDKFEAIVGSIKDFSLRIIKSSSNLPPDASFAIKNIDNPVFLINFVCSNTDIKIEHKQEILEVNDLIARGMKLLEYLAREVQLNELKNDIQSKVKLDIDQQQREYLLQQQIKAIQDELGSSPIEQEIPS